MTGYGENALVRGLSFLAEKQAAIANNLANVDTTSFKRRSTVALDTGDRFHSMLDRALSSIDYVESSDLQRGNLRETGNRLDVAINGDQWLRVQDDADRSYYTRNGQLHVSVDGYLSTRDGLKVLDKNGQPMLLGRGDDAPSSLSFSPNGGVTDPDTGKDYGTVAMVALDDASKLVPVGKSLFVDPTNQTGTQAADGLQQGFLEGSNVDSLQELVAMITVERSFSATQKALTGVNQLQQNMISQMLR